MKKTLHQKTMVRRESKKSHSVSLAPSSEKYGVVYTPSRLAMFVADLLVREGKRHNRTLKTILDPAAGEGMLLNAVSNRLPFAELIAIDSDPDAIPFFRSFKIGLLDDFISPKQRQGTSSLEYWKALLPPIDAAIVNPPWSSERIYEKASLKSMGFTLANGQYDSYILFIELTISLLAENGVFAFILPDSLFATQNEPLRRFLLANTELSVVARLGEKLFPDVFRATTVIVGRKSKPTARSRTRCFRLDSTDRDSFLSACFNAKSHILPQARFANNPMRQIDVDTTLEDIRLLETINGSSGVLSRHFKFGRGVEISKGGLVVTCGRCGCSQGIRKDPPDTISCKHCGAQVSVAEADKGSLISNQPAKGYGGILVGESVRRYRLSAPRFIKLSVSGIDYKQPGLFVGPKILIRKTGLGIYAAIDKSSSLTNQTVYILRPLRKMNPDELFFYLGIINSRVIYFYYLKTYGESEWKSHPYITKQILFSLPIPPFTNTTKCLEVSKLAKALSRRYDRDIDWLLEDSVLRVFGLNNVDKQRISETMNRLPNLASVNEMRF